MRNWSDRREYHRLQVDVEKPDVLNKEPRVAEYVCHILPSAARAGATPPVHTRLCIVHPRCCTYDHMWGLECAYIDNKIVGTHHSVLDLRGVVVR